MLTQFEIPFNKGKEAGTFEFVTPPDVPFPIFGRFHKDYAYIAFGGSDVLDLKTILEQVEEKMIGEALVRTGGNKNRAAELLGLNRTTLVEKLRRRRASPSQA